MHGASDADLHRVETAPAGFDLVPELGDLLENLLGERMLSQQHVIAALGDLAHRVRASGAHPERRMRLLRGRGLDDDVVEPPIFAAMRERRLAYKGLGDHIEHFLEALVGLLHRYTKAGELVPAIALADAEIEPSARQQIESRGLLGQQHGIVPGQDQYRRAEPQMPRAGAEPGQQIEAGRNLAKAGEMMFDKKCAVIAQRLGLDIVVDEIAEALAAVGIRTGSSRLCATEQSELHRSNLPKLRLPSRSKRIQCKRGRTFSHNSCNDRVIGSCGISAPKFSSARIPLSPSSSCNCCNRSATRSGLPMMTLSRCTSS